MAKANSKVVVLGTSLTAPNDPTPDLLLSVEQQDLAETLEPFALGRVAVTASRMGLDVRDPDVIDRILSAAQQETSIGKTFWQRRCDQLDRYAAQSQVYYIDLGDCIKIGVTINLRARCSQLRVDTDAVLAGEPGDARLESLRHEQFADARIGRRENFRKTAELLSHVELVRNHFGEPKITTYLTQSR